MVCHFPLGSCFWTSPSSLTLYGQRQSPLISFQAIVSPPHRSFGFCRVALAMPLNITPFAALSFLAASACFFQIPVRPSLNCLYRSQVAWHGRPASSKCLSWQLRQGALFLGVTILVCLFPTIAVSLNQF